jgi:hypothetical protein
MYIILIELAILSFGIVIFLLETITEFLESICSALEDYVTRLD